MNCLTIALFYWARGGFSGRIRIVGKKNPFPHFVLIRNGVMTHYVAESQDLVWWRQVSFRGEVVREPYVIRKTPVLWRQEQWELDKEA